MKLGVCCALVDREVVQGDVEVDDGMITAVGILPAARSGIALPGYVDLQVNGFGGVDFLTADVDGYREAAKVFLSTGVTAFQPTLISAPLDVLADAIEVAVEAKRELRPRILGVHLEGPFISPRFKGAHDGRWIIPPRIDTAERLCAGDIVTTMTLGPELPGATELIRWLVAHGVRVSLGHTDPHRRHRRVDPRPRPPRA